MHRTNFHTLLAIGKPKRLIPFLLPFLILSISCGDRELRDELARNQIFAKIIQMEYRGWLESEKFFTENLRSNPYPEARQWSALAIGRIAPRQAFPLLYQFLCERDAAVRAAVAFAIGEIESRARTENGHGDSDSSAVTALMRLLDDPALSVQRRAVEALGKIGSPAEVAEIVRHLEQCPDSQPEDRAYIESSINALGRLKDPAASQALMKLADSKDPEIVWRALAALIQIQSKEAAPLFIKNLNHPDLDVRLVAVQGLGMIRDPRQVDLLLPLLPPRQAPSSNSIPISLRCSALQALAELQNLVAIPSIESALAADPINPAHPDQLNFAIQAADALGHFEAKESEPALRMLLKESPPAANRAMSSLAKILKENPERFFDLTNHSQFAAIAAYTWTHAMMELEDSGVEPKQRAALSITSETASPNHLLSDAFCMALAASRKNSTIAIMETNRGTLEIELFRENAPITVASFVELANDGAYDEMDLSQTPQKRLIEATTIRTQRRFAHTIYGEVNMRPIERGSIGIVLTGQLSDTDQFFISLAPQPYLDGFATCFGRVVSGMQAAERLVAGDHIKHISIKETISFLDYRRY
jgi:peptidyl-prolyl cis-trans isomerase B (cyclophilin B)